MNKNSRKPLSRTSRGHNTDAGGITSSSKAKKSLTITFVVCLTLLFAAFANIQCDVRGFENDSGHSATGSGIHQPSMAAPENIWVVRSNADDSAEGSLRSILGIAGNGDLITFDPNVNWGTMPIELRSTITFGQNDIIIDGGAGVTLKSNGLGLLHSTAADGTLTLNGIIFEGGITAGSGGGLHADGTVVITNCKFIGNKAAFGGGLYAKSATLVNCTFTGNEANEGGGAYVLDKASMINCTFSDNTAATGGGAHVNYGGAALVGCAFTDNTAGDGGGLNVDHGNVVMNNCKFRGNEAGNSLGGGLNVTSGNITMTDCVFDGNTALIYGGGAYSNDGEISVAGCTFTGNAAMGGSAVYSRANGVSTAGDMLITDSGFAYNVSDGGTVSLWHGHATAVNTTFFANTVNDAYSGILDVADAALTHCTFTGNKGSYNVSSSMPVSANNCIMTADELTDNARQPIAGNNNVVGSHAAIFGNNVLTFSYMMPLPGLANVPVIPGLATDAAGNSRTSGACLPGAVNRTAVSFEVTNSNDAGAGSLRERIDSANKYATSADWRVVYFADGEFDIKLNSSIWYNKNIMVYGKLDKNGDPEITLDGGGKNKVFDHRGISAASASYFYGLNITNGSSPNGGGIYSEGRTVTAVSCNFFGNRSADVYGAGGGGGIYAQYGLILIDCNFTGNEADRGGGAATNSGNATLINCTFAGNKADLGGGLFANSDNSVITLMGCVFAGNEAAAGGAVFSEAAGLLLTVNSTVSENKTGNSDSGALDCPASVHIFQTTITDNVGGGLHAWYYSSDMYLYNSIVTGNVGVDGYTPRQAAGNAFTNVSSLIEGNAIPGSPSGVPVTERQVFGMNAFEYGTGSHNVLSNGIACGKAAAITGIPGTGLPDAQKQKVMNAIAYDQNGVPRTGTNVSYGAVEIPGYWLVAVSVTKDPVKVVYEIGETVVLNGTELTLNYSNGAENPIPYNEPGMTNTSSDMDMSTGGSKRIDFTFLGVSTKDDTCLRITVNQYYHELEYDLNGGISGTGPGKVTGLLPQNGYELDTETIPLYAENRDAAIVFIGWSMTADGKIYSKADAAPKTITAVDITDNVTVYAVWGYDANGNGVPDVNEDRYTLTYDLNGGIFGTGPETVTGLLAQNGYALDIETIPSYAENRGTVIVFIGWLLTADGKIYPKADAAPKTITAVDITDNVMVYAVWGYDEKVDIGTTDTEEDQYTLTASVTGHGKIQWSLNSITYEDLTGPLTLSAGTEVYLKAVPGEGMQFFKWTGDLTGSDHTAAMIMDSSKAVAADFGSGAYDALSKHSHWWYLVPLLILLTILAMGYWWWIAAARGREIIVTKVYADDAMIYGDDTASWKTEYTFFVSGSGKVNYRVGEEGVWKPLEANEGGEYTIPREDVTDHMTVELK